MFYNNANNRIVISIGPMNDQFEQLKFLPKDIFAISLLVIHASIFGVSSLRRRLTAVSPSINSIHREPRRDQFPVHTPSQARNESATRALSPRRPSISVARLPDTRQHTQLINCFTGCFAVKRPDRGSIFGSRGDCAYISWTPRYINLLYNYPDGKYCCRDTFFRKNDESLTNKLNLFPPLQILYFLILPMSK